MTDDKLADEIERQLRNDPSLDPSIMLGEEKWIAIIAALRRQPSSDKVLVPRESLEWIARQQLENDLGHDAYVASEAVALAQRLLAAAEAEGHHE